MGFLTACFAASFCNAVEKPHTAKGKEKVTASDMPRSHGRCRRKVRVSHCTHPWPSPSLGHHVSWQRHRSPSFLSNTVTMSDQNTQFISHVFISSRNQICQSAEDSLNRSQHSSRQESSSSSPLLMALSPQRTVTHPLTAAL